VKKIIKVERGVYNSLTCLHAGKSACQKKRARRLANWQASQLAPTLKPPNVRWNIQLRRPLGKLSKEEQVVKES
jgi:hypothetical protein